MTTETCMKLTTSRLLQSLRAIGIIVDNKPIEMYKMGHQMFLIASIKKAFVVYDAAHLKTALVSPPLTKNISSIQVNSLKQHTFTASDTLIYVWKRVHIVKVLSGHKARIRQLLSLQSILISLDEARTVRIWDTDVLQEIHAIHFPAAFKPTVMMHPATYINKILFGSEDGTLELWNISSQRKIHTFLGLVGCSVTCITQSPATDVVAIGQSNGSISVYNLQYDQLLMRFQHERGKVCAISFRSDANAIVPLMVSGCDRGNIAIWNLEKQKLESMIQSAHDGSISSLIFLPKEPVLVSSGDDNSLKEWIFDQSHPGKLARLLRSRQGHQSPPTRVRYYGSNIFASMHDGSDGRSCQILSAGSDRAFRVFHTQREEQSIEMSQGPIVKKRISTHLPPKELKLKPITQFASLETRERDWANVVTCHDGEIAAYLWRMEHRVIETKVLSPYESIARLPRHVQQQARATSCAISSCGNYALVGTLGGNIFKYNMQSGICRGSYPITAAEEMNDSTISTSSGLGQDESDSTARHQGLVSGVAVDALNRMLISVGMDGLIKFWNFKTHQPLAQLNVHAPISQLLIHRDSHLAVVVADDQILRLYDTSTKKLVRKFQGNAHRVTDVCFSFDARWLFSACADATVRIWDIPAGKCIDWVRFQYPVTSITISPTDEFIATTHVGQVGIYLWANRTFVTDVLLDSEPQAPVALDLPLPADEDNLDEIKVDTLVIGDDNVSAKFEVDAAVCMDTGLITLSDTPKAVWHSLFHLELIKKRNRPIESPQVAEPAPFFLPSRHAGTESFFVPITKTSPEADQDNVSSEDIARTELKTQGRRSRIIESNNLVSSRSKLAMLLNDYEDEKNLQSRTDDVLAYLTSLSASSVEIEISTLCIGDFDMEGESLLMQFLKFVELVSKTRQHFQLMQAYLNRVLKIYEDIILKSPALWEKVQCIGEIQVTQWAHLRECLQNTLCLAKHLSKIQM